MTAIIIAIVLTALISITATRIFDRRRQNALIATYKLDIEDVAKTTFDAGWRAGNDHGKHTAAMERYLKNQTL